MIEASRRGFLGGLLALLAAPAVVRASSLMPVSVMPDEEVLVQLAGRNNLLTINMITKEAIRLWKNSNAFVENLDKRYDGAFARDNVKIGTSYRILLPRTVASNVL